MLKFSLILPCYNVEQFLRGGVESLLNQKYNLGTDYEIILVDDASTDGTLREIQQFANHPGITIIPKAQNGGVSAARNTGLEAARGELVWFIDPDDFIAPDILPVIWDAYQSHPGVNGVQFYYKRVTEDSAPGNIVIFDNVRANNGVYCHPIQREFLLRNNIRFDERLQYNEDHVYNFFLWLYEAKFVEIESDIYFYRQRQGSLMRVKEDAAKSARKQQDTLTMLSIYKKVELQAENGNYPAKLKGIRARANQAVWAILMSSVWKSVHDSEATLQQLIKEGVYPYHTLWRNLTFKHGLKNFVINAGSLFFSHAWYYRAVNRIVNLRRTSR